MKNENVWVLRVSNDATQWQLIVILNALVNEKMTVILFYTHRQDNFIREKIPHKRSNWAHNRHAIIRCFAQMFESSTRKY